MPSLARSRSWGPHEIRDLKQGPDGWIYMISRNTNQIFRIER